MIIKDHKNAASKSFLALQKPVRRNAAVCIQERNIVSLPSYLRHCNVPCN